MCPWTWEHAHNHVLLTFRMYYLGVELDPNMPTAKVCPHMNIPIVRPGTTLAAEAAKNNSPAITSAMPLAPSMLPPRALKKVPGIQPAVVVAPPAPTLTPPAAAAAAAAAPVSSAEMDESRRMLLQEVKDHLAVLKEFEGVVDASEIEQRKRELFASLPPAPKRARID